MARSAAAQVAGIQRPGGSEGAPEESGKPWWRISWSAPAAIRAVRAAIVTPFLFALTFKVIGDAQMALFAVFGSFAQLVTVTFGGSQRDKAVAHLLLAAAGSVAVVIGTFASGSAWLAALVTLVTAFAIYAAGSAGPNAAAGVTPCLFALVLPVASVGTASVLPSRVEGWLLASAASTLAVLLFSPRAAGDRLRAQAAKLASTLADQLAAMIRGTPAAAHDDAAKTAQDELMNAFAASPWRPIGLAAADHALASTIHMLDLCSSLISTAADAHREPGAAPLDRDLMTQCMQTLRQVAAVLSGQEVNMDLEALYRGRLAAADYLHEAAHDPAVAERRALHAFHSLATAVFIAATIGAAMIATRRATPAQIARLRRRWIAGLPDAVIGHAPSTEVRPAGVIAEDPALRSVWVRSSIRGAIALAAAVAVARVTDVQHAFWVVLGTLSVLRTTATTTSSTALHALAGTFVGFAVGAALLVGIGTNPTALWIVYPLAVLVAAYTPGTAPFVFGQAAFTISSVVLFNLLAPVGWRVGLLRVEDIAIGCAVSLVVGFLLWPRGVSSVVTDDLGKAFSSGAGYLGDAARGALGDRERRPERAAAAIEAAAKLDDGLLGFLTQQGSKRLSKADLWTLVTAAMRLRLTADTMASLPTSAHDDDCRLKAAIRRQVAVLASFYGGVAAEIARPSRTREALATVSPPPKSLSAEELAPCGHSTTYRSDALCVGYLVNHLAASLTELTGPVERLAKMRRRPWWR